MTTSLFWFRRDLRLQDNCALAAAVAASDLTYGVFSTEDLELLNNRQRGFVTGALRSLTSDLGKLDASLSIAEGEADFALVAAAHRLGAQTVYVTRALDRRERAIERRVQAALRAAGISLHAIGASTVHEPEAIAELKQSSGEGYRIFPPFYDVWKTLTPQRASETTAPNGRDPVPGEVPSTQALASAPVASESAAIDALARFVSARAADYGANAEYPGRAATSNLAPYLRFGMMGARATYRAIVEKMARSWTLAQERLSMEAFLRRLALRDFYIHLAYYERDVFEEPLQTKMRGFPWSQDEAMLTAWREGKTGYPLVDAAMRQLASEGHVHGRAAVVAASFCTADLGLDWRLGHQVWMDDLLEADEALSIGNWQHVAGIGSDQAAYPRIYNPVRQAQLFDSQATYVRRYCKELSKLPTRAALAPWEIGKQQQIELGFFTPQQYPAPIVDHETAARAFLAKYQNFRSRAS